MKTAGSCLVCVFVSLYGAVSAVVAGGGTSKRPNIVIMLADDMGYGEVSALNPERGKTKTPRLDHLAASGLVFTDAHSASSVCTPTRYGLLTGRYAWRTRLQSGVLTGGESLIAEERQTLAKFLRAHGYYTGIVGKWHLGMLLDGKHEKKEVPVGAKVTHGPIDRGGFDEFHGFHHARQIRLWVENERVSENLQPIDMLPRLAKEACDFVRRQSESEQPFFLYVPWSSPHSPVVPSREWQGKSGLNAHADFVMQTDDCFGQVVDALSATGQLENTLIICSSDNGTSAPTSNMKQLIAKGHFPSASLRGSKADIWEGGHRVPFIVSWPAVIRSHREVDRLVSLNDIFATVAQVIGESVPYDAAEDSFSFAAELGGAFDDTDKRDAFVHHSSSGYFAIRTRDWKLCLCPGSGGWTQPKPSWQNWERIKSLGQPLVQLYDLEKDLAEQNNLASAQPDRVAELTNRLVQIVESGYSYPGRTGSNDVAVEIHKRPRKNKK